MRLLRLFLGLVILAGLTIGVAAVSIGIALIDEYGRGLPDHLTLRNYVPRTGSEVLAADGSILAKRAEERRVYVSIDGIPDLVKQAFVAAEDQNYWKHNGVDPVAIARAGVSYVAHSNKSGASTITQQVAKNLLVGNERSVERKIREALLAMWMDRDIGKQRILEIYLNEIYLGLGAYGVAEAADTFFGKSLDQLNAAEAALLAAMPKAPSAFNPVRNPQRATERRAYVLRRMFEDGYIPQAVYHKAAYEKLALAPRKEREKSETFTGGWFEENAWRSVQDFVTQGDLARTDVIVKTTLNPKLQAAATEALRKGVLQADRQLGWRGPLTKTRFPVDWTDPELAPPSGAYPYVVGVVERSATVAEIALVDGGRVALDAAGVRWTGRRPAEILRRGDVILLDVSGPAPELVQTPEVEGALVALDPRSGDVQALVGGFSRERSVFDRATQAKRQPGSAFKPVVYLTALELGYDATSPLLDASIVLEQGPGQDDWRPSDAKGAGKGGLITLRNAFEKSRNMAAVRLLWDIGLDDVGNMARRLGVDPGKPMSYALGLGAGEVTPMQMALAYGTIANGGKALRPRYVSELLNRDGVSVGLVPPAIGAQIVDPIAASQMVSVMRGVVERGTAKTAFEGFKRPFGGKTGTTNSARDTWFVGVASDVVVAVWIGRDDNRPLAEGASGGRTAAATVRDFLDRAGSELKLGEPPVPQGVHLVVSDALTGLPTRGEGGVAEIIRGAPPPDVVADHEVQQVATKPRRKRREVPPPSDEASPLIILPMEPE